MCLVKIHVLSSSGKGNDYRVEKRRIATLHTLVSWGIELLPFLLFFFRDDGVRLLLSSCYSLNQQFARGVYRLSSEFILRGKKAKHFLSIKTLI